MVSSVTGITIDELSEIYRVEKKSRGLSTVRHDLFKAMAECLKETRKNYEELLRENPDTLMCEGANSRRKKCQQYSRDIIDMRMRKINQMALRGAIGGNNSLDAMTEEEKDYYESILALSKNHIALLERLSGNIRYVTKDLTTIGQPVPIPEEPIPVPEAEEPVEEYYEPEDDIPIPQAETVPATPVQPIEKHEDELPAEIPMDLVPEEGEFDMDEDPEMDIPDDELDRMAPMEKPKSEVKTEDDADFMLLRVLEDVPTFVGPTRNYTLKAKQVVRMPTMIAQVMINNNLAVQIKNSP